MKQMHSIVPGLFRETRVRRNKSLLHFSIIHFYRAVSCFNQLPIEIRNAATLRSFKILLIILKEDIHEQILPFIINMIVFIPLMYPIGILFNSF